MRLIRDLNQLPDQLRGGALSIGNFDGVHRGHARIVERLVAMARRVGGPAVVFTFDPHPAQILRPEAAPTPLGWTDRNAELLAALGADAVIAYPTDREFLQLEAREFFDQIVREKLDARAMVEGENFFFGHNRSGNVDVLREFCREADMPLQIVESLVFDGAVVSSSRVRQLVASGDVAAARSLLARPYRIRGTVVRGAGRGAKLGFPTANLDQTDTILPAEGIYAGAAWVGTDRWPAAVSVGSNPTFGEGALKVEPYLIGFDGDLYDQVIEVDFLARLRDIERFDSVDALIAQMDRDVDATRQVLDQHP